MSSVDGLLGMIPEVLARMDGIERRQDEILRMLVEKDDRLVPHADACKMLGVSLPTLRRLDALHDLGGRKLGRGWVFPLSKLVSASVQPMSPVLHIEKRRKGRPRGIVV